MTGILISGKMSVGFLSAAKGLRIRIASTTNVGPQGEPDDHRHLTDTASSRRCAPPPSAADEPAQINASLKTKSLRRGGRVKLNSPARARPKACPSALKSRAA